MRINADFTRPARLLPDEQCWVPSPQSGVTRVMLDRVGEEKARATSRVRYQAGSVSKAGNLPLWRQQRMCNITPDALQVLWPGR